MELELVGSVLSDPDRRVALAARETIACGLFDCEDLRLIFAAALVACDRRHKGGRFSFRHRYPLHQMTK